MFSRCVATLIIVVIGPMLTVPPVCAQESAQSQREAMYYRYLDFASYVKGGSIQPHWMADGSSFWYAEGAPANTVIWKLDPKANTKTPLFDTARLRKALTSLLGHEPPGQGLPFENFSFVDGEKTIRFKVEDQAFDLQRDTYAVNRAMRRLDEGGNELKPQTVGKDLFGFDLREIPSPDGKWFAHLKDHNLWLRSTSDGRLIALTTDGAEDHEWGEEFEWDKDYGRPWAWWSPDGSKLAVRKIDDRHVPKIPIVSYGKLREEIEWVWYPRMGDTWRKRALYIFDIPTKRQILVNTGAEAEHIISVQGWHPSGSEFLFLRMNPEHKRLDLMAAGATTGETRVIVSETRETFFQPLWAWTPQFIRLGDDERFLWTSDRDGWNHIYLYENTGSLVEQLTEGPFPIHNIVTVDEQAGWVYFYAHGDRRRPYDLHLNRVRLNGTGFAQLTEASGQHAIQFAPSKRFFLDTHSSVDRPSVTELRRADGMLLRTPSRANIEALEALGWVPPEEFIVKGADGSTDVFGVLYKPYDFDPNRQYPVIEYIYAAGSRLVPRTFAPGKAYWATDDHFPLDQIDPKALAQLGFIVLVVDGWGTLERGQKLRDAVLPFGHEIPDHVAVLKQVAQRRPYMDLSRMGIFGISAGGFNTLRALLTVPDVYHVGVAIAGAADLCTLRVSVKGLRKPGDCESLSNIPLAGNLIGKLLMIHGTSDRLTPISQTMRMVQALIEAGKPYHLVVLPGQEHLFAGSGARYAREATRRYFQEHLKPERVVMVPEGSPSLK